MHMLHVGAQLLEPQPYRTPAVCTTNLGRTASLRCAGGAEAARRDLLTGVTQTTHTRRTLSLCTGSRQLTGDRQGHCLPTGVFPWGRRQLLSPFKTTRRTEKVFTQTKTDAPRLRGDVLLTLVGR